MKSIIKKCPWIFLVCLATIQTLHSHTDNPSQNTVLSDSSLVYGKLPNGFTYYIKDIPNAPNIQLKLLVKVGYYNEDLDQKEFSHIIEHLAFSDASITQISENLKKQPGVTMKALTTNEKTSYNLKIPVNQMNILHKGLLWFKKIFDLNLTPDNIAREKGIIMQEILYRNGNHLDQHYLRMNLFSKLFMCNSSFQNHSNFKDHIKGFSSQSLRNFYRKWYHPERTALIITGDIGNMDEIEKRIHEQFSDIQAQNNTFFSMEKDCRKSYLQSPNQFVIQENNQDKNSHLNNQEIQLTLLYRDKEILVPESSSKEGIHRELLWSFINNMIVQRIQKKQIWGISTNAPNYSKPYYAVTISNDDGSEMQNLQSFTKLIQQIKTDGFLDVEWEKAQDQLKHLYSNTTQFWIQKIAECFLNEKRLYNSNQHYNQKLEEFTLDTINSFAKQYLSIMPNDIGIIAPKGNKATTYSESKIRGWIKSAAATPTSSYVTPKEKLLLPPNEIASLKQIECIFEGENQIGIEELIFDNGIRVALHNYKFSGLYKNQISIHGFSTKGALYLPEADYFSAINAPLIIKTAGLGNLTGKEIQFIKSENNLYFKAYIHPLETGIKIRGKKNEMEQMLQLMYLSFSQPRYPENSDFENWKKIERNRYIKPYINSRVLDFEEKIAEIINDKSIILKHGSTSRYKGIIQTNKDRAYNIYRKLFGNASDFTIIISGDFSKDTILPLIKKYIGNLPNANNHTPISNSNANTDYQINLPKHPLYRKFKIDYQNVSYDKQNNKYYMLCFISKATDIHDWKERTKVVFLAKLIRKKLLDFRYKKNAALYYSNAFGTLNKYLKIYKVGIFLDCTENELGWLREESKLLMDDIKEGKFNSEDFTAVKAEMLNLYGQNRNTLKMYSPGEVYRYYLNNKHLINDKQQVDFVQSLTIEDLLDTANKYLKKRHMMEFVM